MIGAVAAGVALLVAVVWVWGRPWWQERSLTNALQDIHGVQTVDRAEDDPYNLKLDIAFADDITAEQLAGAMERVDQEVDDHEVSGDRAGVEMRVAGFVLEPYRGLLSTDILGTVLALRDVEGLTGIEADDHEITMSVADNADLLPAAIKALEVVADVKVSPFGDATIRIVSSRGRAALRSTLSGAASQSAALEGLGRAVSRSGAEFRVINSSFPSVTTFARGDNAAECDVNLTVERTERLRAVARVLAMEAPQCGVALAVGEDPDSPVSLRLPPRIAVAD